MVSAALPVLSPLVTRIIQISGFSSNLKTRDISAMFAPWEDDRGGFKIKWVDDTTVLVIFADPATAKKAYLNTLVAFPPALIDSSGKRATVRPYDGEDASAVIASVHHRTRSRSNAANLMGSPSSPAKAPSPLPGGIASSPSKHRHTGSNVSLGGASGSISRATGSFAKGHLRHPSGSNPSSLPPKPIAAALYDAANGGPSPAHHLQNVAREQGMTLPPPTAIPAGRPVDNDELEQLAIESDGTGSISASHLPSTRAGRVGDAGKRLVAGALGVRRPGVPDSGSRVGDAAPASGDDSAAATLPQGMEDLNIS